MNTTTLEITQTRQDMELVPSYQLGAQKRRKIFEADHSNDLEDKHLQIGDESPIKYPSMSFINLDFTEKVEKINLPMKMTVSQQIQNQDQDASQDHLNNNMKDQNKDAYLKNKTFANQDSLNNQKNHKKNRNLLNILLLILKFANKLKLHQKFRTIFSLEKKHFDIIGDMSYGGQILYKLPKNSIVRYLLRSFMDLIKCLKRIDIQIPVFSPHNIIVSLFQSIMILIIMFQLIFLPYKVSFNLQFNDTYAPYYISYYVILFFLVIEQMINFNLGYFFQGYIILDRNKIIQQQFKYKFWENTVVILSLLYTSRFQTSLYSFTFLLKLTDLIQIMEILDQRFQIQQRIPVFLEFARLIIIIIIVAHYCGCGFHYLAQYEKLDNRDDTWLDAQSLTQSDNYERYINSLYYSFITMITVGYGDISPKTTQEKIYVIFMTLISCGVFAFAVNTIGSIFNEIAKKTAQIRQNKFDVTQYMRNRNISTYMQVKVIKYLEYIHNMKDESNQKGEVILNNMISKNLRKEVFQEFYGKILKQMKLFKLNFSQQFINEFCMQMKELWLGPEELLFQEGELDQKLYFVFKGEIEIFIKRQEKYQFQNDITLGGFKEKQFFGQSGFLANKHRQYSARSKQVSHIIYCTQEDFLNTIKNFTADYRLA